MQSIVFDKIFRDHEGSINLGCTINRWSGSPTVLKNIPDKKRKLNMQHKIERLLWQFFKFFVLNKTYHLALRDSALLHPESAPLVHGMVHFFKVYLFVSCFPIMSIHRTKLKYGIVKVKAYEKSKWMIELSTKYIFSDKSVLL